MKQYRMAALNSNEFSEIMGLLEVNGLVGVKGGADERQRVITLKCCKEEVEAGVDAKFVDMLRDLMPGKMDAKEN
jgi:hypothetical protein